MIVKKYYVRITSTCNVVRTNLQSGIPLPLTGAWSMPTKNNAKNPAGENQELEKSLREFSAMSADACCATLHTNVSGLEATQVAAARNAVGLNNIDLQKAPSWLTQLLRSFLFPFNAVLLVILLISFFTDVIMPDAGSRDFKTIAMLSTMILLSSLIRFWQEYRSSKAAEALRSMIRTTATVQRSGTAEVEIPIVELVPGDIVHLAAGDMIPADCRLLQSKDLFLSQSLLTGESNPIEKHSHAALDTATIAFIDLPNICFMGTTVASGAAVAVIVLTGTHTYLASISKSIAQSDTKTSFDKGVNSVSYLLMRYMMIMVPLVFLINGLTKGNWIEALLFAISVAVGLTPEMLPMIVSTNLARGAVGMSRKRVIVKRLSAIQNIGAMDVLCTDKTGTLTMDKIVFKRALNVYGEEDDEVLQWAYLNAYHQTGLRNMMDRSVLEHQEILTEHRIDTRFTKVDEIPFDFHRRRMSVILHQPNNKHLLVCKGAVEEMLDICTHTFDPGEDRQLQIEHDTITILDDITRQRISELSRKLNEDGLRVLLIAVREFEARELNYGVADESKLIVAGFIGFLDPAKESARESISGLQQLGVQVKVLSGDNEVVCAKICRDVGIPQHHILLGAQIEHMTDEVLSAELEQTDIMAKLSPMQKSRIIKLLQLRGHTVGYLGDGINDATALSDADVGISVDTAVDLAKESADIILLDKDLLVLRSAVEVGRITFGNIIKYIKMAASSNFGNMFSMLGASAVLPFLPMMPIQILLQNLLYDISQISIPWDTMDDEYIAVPRKWDASDISTFMLHIGPISSIFDYVTFALLYFVFQANTPAQHSLFQSGWFVEAMLSQSLIVHMIRTRKIPFVQSHASGPVLILSGLIMCITVYLPFSSFAPALSLQALPLSYFGYVAAILLSYAILTQIAKNWYTKRFGRWM